MSFNSIVKLFLPKDKVFYQLFEEVAELLVQMSELLRDMVHEKDATKREDIGKQIEDLEHKNDDLTHTIFVTLSKNFITPFDREDIHYLATSLDDIADYIYAAAKKINVYHVDISDTGIQEFCELIPAGCKEVRNAIFELRNMKNIRKIMDALVAINSIENQADDVYDTCTEALFEDDKVVAKEVIKRKEIYGFMEMVTDKCEDAGNVVESIVVKYA